MHLHCTLCIGGEGKYSSTATLYRQAAFVTGVSVGDTRVNQSKVAVDLETCPVHEICVSFGKFVSFKVVESIDEEILEVDAAAEPSSATTTPTVTDMLMATARNLAKQYHIQNGNFWPANMLIWQDCTTVLTTYSTQFGKMGEWTLQLMTRHSSKHCSLLFGI